ncbi:hypothetical protein HXX76_011841 [Chlamydomonas incerta]|uniref:U-box domain-containing protein n=1 Tax=Chlamydomonas incerta TaxID=51695 RepID=A0A835SM75_CHLIN|nr:hypothetical protein HXX76_011841 [Chlamydomonas incerta]|eukprot:KAG2428161.1 hypothetical protein HXX76_011841 [Chlamydomonas incerta]
MGTSYSKSSRKGGGSGECEHHHGARYPTIPTATPAVGGFAQFQSPTLKFRAIADHYGSLEQVQDDLRKNGLESSNLIVAVDFTKSNEWTGKRSFGGRSLHAIGEQPNPYEEAIGVIGRTLSAFDDDGLIPCYGFGDVTTGDSSVFSFLADDQPCRGLEQALWRYRELCPYIRMAGPTSFAPAIRQAARIVEGSGGQYHILLLVADGQVSRPSGMPEHHKSEQEQETINAIVEASSLPLSIIMVGVGDGPWDLMKDFDDALPERSFDNFQFVNFSELMATTQGDRTRREALFALRALMEIPEQYNAIQRMGILGGTAAAQLARSRTQRRRGNPPLDPPVPPHLMSGSTSGPSTSAAAGAGGPAAAYGGAAAAYGGAAAAGPGGYPAAGPGPSAAGPYPPPRPPSASCSGTYGAGGAGAAAGAGPSGPSGPGPSKGTQSARTSGTGYGGGGGGAAATGPTPVAPAASGPVPDPMFVCPITQDVMRDPVIATDGYTYERSAITDWLARKAVSPLTNAKMPGGNTLIPNHNLRSSIMEWKQKNGLA